MARKPSRRPGRYCIRRSLVFTMRHAKITLAITIVIFGISLWLARFVPSQFFPASDRPELVVEVRYDKVQGSRFRHGTKLLRWRDDKPPRQCTMDQLKTARPSLKLLEMKTTTKRKTAAG